ncbi:MAG: flagellar assembly protein FliW [Verrucomicrobiota bacterium]
MNTATAPVLPTLDTLRNKMIEFRHGLPGFPTSRHFLMAQEPEERPFAWLQSIDEPRVKFAVVDAYAWDGDFTLEVDDDVLEELGSLDPLDFAVYFILLIQKRKGGTTTMQAKPNAPLLVNVRNRQARQVIVPSPATLVKAEALCLQL